MTIVNFKSNKEDNLNTAGEDIKISDIINLDFLQKFQDLFSEATGISSLTTDIHGNPITKASNHTEFCMKFNRGCKEGASRCIKSDALGGAESAKTGKPAVYYCSNGLIDFAAPIMIEGKQIGTILGGQVLDSSPDKEKYVKIAHEIGVDPDQYLAALDKVKIVPEEQIRAAAELLFLFSQEISRMGFQNLCIKNMSKVLHDSVMQIMATVEELTASATEVVQNQSLLNEEIQNVKIVSSKINEISKDIKNIAHKTGLLGFNASIEAARAGDKGNAFNVIAEMIRTLSNDSKNTVEKIEELTFKIDSSITRTIEIGGLTVSVTRQEEIAINDIVDSIEDIVYMSDNLKNLVADNDIIK